VAGVACAPGDGADGGGSAVHAAARGHRGRLFGTDGVRGIANGDLTPLLAYQLGRAGTFCLMRGDGRPRIMVGRDTRASGEMLEAALVAGICSVGADVVRAGIMTTPGVAMLVQRRGCTAGIVISASHNPAQYNGIKFFSSDGYKLPDDIEAQIEDLILEGGVDRLPSPLAEGVGRTCDDAGASAEYCAFLGSTVPGLRLQGRRVVLDCANGAASHIAPQVFAGLGAEVTAIHDHPDGLNINRRCGAIDVRSLQRSVRELGAVVGLAFDGDADRLIAVDETGAAVDGDAILVACALFLDARGELPLRTVVSTVMANLGVDRALGEAGIGVVRVHVGDRHVLEAMRKRGLALGGEQSGHIIFLRHATTGDGILTGLQLVRVMQDSGLPLSKLAARMERLPQCLVNVTVADRQAVHGAERVVAAVAAAEAKLKPWGRVVVRPSGTEPMVRVMVEGEDDELVRRLAGELADIIGRECGAG
jgi:phosphoglucosamine mutase